MSQFRVVSTIWHTKDNKYYEPGEVVDLSHLDGLAIDLLLKSGAVEMLPTKTEEKKAAALEKENK